MFQEAAHALALFGQHLFLGMILAVGFVCIYSLVTPHKELELIRAGNAAAAVGLVGATIGFALPLSLVLSVTADPVHAGFWGIVALVTQIIAHLLVRLVVPHLVRDINEGKMSAGIVQAGAGLVIGMISAAALTP
jgi:putative membrane protein